MSYGGPKPPNGHDGFNNPEDWTVEGAQYELILPKEPGDVPAPFSGIGGNNRMLQEYIYGSVDIVEIPTNRPDVMFIVAHGSPNGGVTPNVPLFTDLLDEDMRNDFSERMGGYYDDQEARTLITEAEYAFREGMIDKEQFDAIMNIVLCRELYLREFGSNYVFKGDDGNYYRIYKFPGLNTAGETEDNEDV